MTTTPAPLKSGDRVRLPSGREATLHHIRLPGPPDGAPFLRAWHVSEVSELTYYEDELALVEAAPTQPPADGPVPGLAEAVRSVVASLKGGGRIEEASYRLRSDIARRVANPEARCYLEGLGLELWQELASAFDVLGRAIAAEEERAKLRREAAEAIGAKLARSAFARRGNHAEIHLAEQELAGICALAAELGSTP